MLPKVRGQAPFSSRALTSSVEQQMYLPQKFKGFCGFPSNFPVLHSAVKPDLEY